MISYGLQNFVFAQSFNYLLINGCKQLLMSNFVRIINSSMNKCNQSYSNKLVVLFLIVI